MLQTASSGIKGPDTVANRIHNVLTRKVIRYAVIEHAVRPPMGARESVVAKNTCATGANVWRSVAMRGAILRPKYARRSLNAMVGKRRQ
jgi:hypothetical protein